MLLCDGQSQTGGTGLNRRASSISGPGRSVSEPVKMLKLNLSAHGMVLSEAVPSPKARKGPEASSHAGVWSRADK